MTWTAITDDGACWELPAMCGDETELDPYITRDPGEPAVTAYCAESACSTQ